MLSVICPIYNEERYIQECIESILRQDYPKDDLEVFFVDGMSRDRTRELIEPYIKQYPFMHLLDNPHKIVPYALNIGISASHGDVIIRFDGHATYESNYFSTLVRWLKELKADNVGAVCHTDVLRKTPKTCAIREVLSNRFGVGNSVFRTGIDTVQEVDTVPFGCWRRDVFDKYGLFDPRLVRNQDIEYNKRILHHGGKIFIVPDTFCTYFARESYRALAKNNFGNGMWNILTVHYTHLISSLSLRHFIPLLFLLSLILPVIASLIWAPFIYVARLSLTSYLLAMGTISLYLSLKKHLQFRYLLLTFTVLHFSYGLGSLSGIVYLLYQRLNKFGELD